MSFALVFKPLAQAEIADAFAWYEQQGGCVEREFLDELERVERFIRFNPLLYPQVETEVRRAGLRRLPYSLFYVVEGRSVLVLSCFHQHRDPRLIG